MPKPTPGQPGPLPHSFGTQLGLREPDAVDTIKADMLLGRFDYQIGSARVTGLRDQKGDYYVKDGHHRMAAALEIYNETGDASFVVQLLLWGKWDNVDNPPNDRCPLPARGWWEAFWNWLAHWF